MRFGHQFCESSSFLALLFIELKDTIAEHVWMMLRADASMHFPQLPQFSKSLVNFCIRKSLFFFFWHKKTSKQPLLKLSSLLEHSGVWLFPVISDQSHQWLLLTLFSVSSLMRISTLKILSLESVMRPDFQY